MSILRTADCKCPMCDTKFTFRIQTSYTLFGRYLDFKPWGAALIPDPIPRCRNCGLVFNNTSMFSKQNMAQLKILLKDNNVFKTEPNMPSYYYLAKEYELLGGNIHRIISFYHTATWEYIRFEIFEKIANILFDYFVKIDKKDIEYYKYQLIKLDFLRRLEKFSEAKDLILVLRNDDKFPKEQFMKVLNYQTELIDNSDTREHQIPDDSDFEQIHLK